MDPLRKQYGSRMDSTWIQYAFNICSYGFNMIRSGFDMYSRWLYYDLKSNSIWFMDAVCIQHEFNMESIWHQAWNYHEIDMDLSWIRYGSNMVLIWLQSGFNMDSLWIQPGFKMDSTWTQIGSNGTSM